METLPLVLFAVLFELAVGGAIVMWTLERIAETPAGFMRLAGVVGAAAAAFGALVGLSLPRVEETAERAAIAVAVLLGLYFVTTFLPSKPLRNVTGAFAIVLGLGMLVFFSLPPARPGDDPFDVLALAALPLGALALGGSNAAMLLGHWYLVTPKLPPGPLQTASLLFFGAVVAQALALVFATGRGDLATAWETSGIAVFIRVVVGILAPAVIALGAWWTARMNTQSSTGLLYVGLGMVLAGEICARVVFYIAGVAI